MTHARHIESHHTKRIGWLRAAVLGANDGIVSTASLMVGVAAANADRFDLLVAGVAGVVAGAMSMAAGEYVSVSSQSDAQQADLLRESAELGAQPEHELQELAAIYVTRGLTRGLATRVARQLMARDALAAHAQDELGISESVKARPLQAAITSASTFTLGAALPLLTTVLAPAALVIPLVAGTSLLFLVALGALAACAGGAPVWRAALRVAFWSSLAMAVTAGVGSLFAATV